MVCVIIEKSGVLWVYRDLEPMFLVRSLENGHVVPLEGHLRDSCRCGIEGGDVVTESLEKVLEKLKIWFGRSGVWSPEVVDGSVHVDELKDIHAVCPPSRVANGRNSILVNCTGCLVVSTLWPLDLVDIFRGGEGIALVPDPGGVEHVEALGEVRHVVWICGRRRVGFTCAFH